MTNVEPPMDDQTLRQMIARQIACVLRLDPAQIDPNATFDEYGLDSVDSLIALSLVEEQLNIELPPELFLQHRTIDAVLLALRAKGKVP